MGLVLTGSTSGTTTIDATAIAGTGVLTLPTGTDTLVGLAATQTLTNKTLTTPDLGTPSTLVLTNATGLAAAAMPAGSVLQVVQTLNNANTSGSVAIPNDNTIPQITEGVQYLTCTIVPKRATSNLWVQVILFTSETANNANNGAAALFRDATASAIAVAALGQHGVSYLEGGGPTVLSILTPSNSTSSTTFTVRAGVDTNYPLVMNTSADGTYPKWGGVYYSGITITEVAV